MLCGHYARIQHHSIKKLTIYVSASQRDSIIQRVQDVEPIIENNKRLQAEGKGYSSSRELRRIASIPMVVVERWIQEDGVNFMALGKQEKSAYLRKKLNDSDNRAWRNSDGAF